VQRVHDRPIVSLQASAAATVENAHLRDNDSKRTIWAVRLSCLENEYSRPLLFSRRFWPEK